ncbi:E3 ubiquitin ligase TRIM40-like isoform X2 [Silurus meridionalis]|uniref:E3 ubiquitin ligase TRIM40-like isoform X2 n=1 Tax=Silurus meridionalis TaxID=175797 RepID=UPI001EEC16A1|nr:E3 ubiquitin ligase TRIM40-like isoform X2 [Silurus meridionalis]
MYNIYKIYHSIFSSLCCEMAHAGILNQTQYNCSICQDELKDPVTLPCGHNFCKACINGYWDQGVYVCPQCRQSFTPRLVLGTNEVLVYAMDKIKQTAIRAASAPRAESQNVSRSEDQSELESCVRSLELFSIDFHKDLDDLMNMLPELESSTRVLGIILSQALEAASVPQSQNVSRSEGLSEVVPHLSSLMLDRIRKDLDDLMNMMSELKSSMGVLRIILSQVPEAASVPQSQNVRRSEGLSEVKSFAETMELNKENIKKVVAKMKPMMPYLRIILQQRIKSQSQAPNAASTPQVQSVDVAAFNKI